MDGTSKPAYKQLEEEFADFSGYKYASACNSGTSALTLAVAALGIGEGDAVMIPKFTMVACRWAVEYNGAKVVEVPSTEHDLNIDVEYLRSDITPDVKAIMPVHIYGRVCNMEEVREFADEYGIWVIEDRAEAHGADIPFKGDIACYSLYKNKIVSAQEGGVVVTDIESVKRRIDRLKNMSFTRDHDYRHPVRGWNMRMPDAQAELGLSSLRNVEQELKERREWESWCNSMVPEFIQMPLRDVLWVYDIMCRNNAERKGLQAYLDERGGVYRRFFDPGSLAWGVGLYVPYKEDRTIKLIKEFYETSSNWG